MSRSAAVSIVVICALLGAAIGYALGSNGFLTFFPTDAVIPAPHVVPKLPGGTALSFSMVDDVLQERFFRHGNAYYEARNSASHEFMRQEDDQRKAGEDGLMLAAQLRMHKLEGGT